MASDLTPHAPDNRRWWIRWFPLVWWGLLLAAWGGLQFWGLLGLAGDIRSVATLLLINLAWLGPLVWLLFFWPPVRRLRRPSRWLVRVGAAVLVVLGFQSIDVDYDGDSRIKSIRSRWWAAPDQRLDQLSTTGKVADDWQPTPNDYPRFLGRGYWAEVDNVELEADWHGHPPELIWKREIGAGWSAFAIVGDYAVTQEQRGDQELVTCYRVSRDEVVWTHADNTRHDPSSLGGGLGGVGPRATPTIDGDRIYTMGATGFLNCLDARTGDVVWMRHVPSEFDVAPLLWGNSGSPLVVPDTDLIVVNGGQSSDPNGHSLLAFHRDTGELVWQSGPPVTSYASPVSAVLGGVPQIVQVNESSVGGYRVNDGQELWQVEQPGSSSANASCSQPIPLPGERVLVSKGYGIGSRLIELAAGDSASLTPTILWQRPVLNTKLANLVLRDGYAYGLDQTLLSCVEIDTGKVQWKKRRRDPIGHGQLLLVGDVIFALSETGEGILFECNPARYVELAAMDMLTDKGVTWNNPALSGPYLLVRNNLEAACYLLPTVADEVAEE